MLEVQVRPKFARKQIVSIRDEKHQHERVIRRRVENPSLVSIRCNGAKERRIAYQNQNRPLSAQGQILALHLHRALLHIPQPIRERRNLHLVRQHRLAALLLHGEAAGIGQVALHRLGQLVLGSAAQIADDELGRARLHELRRHVAVGGVHDDARGVLAEGVGGWGTAGRLRLVLDERPGSDQLLAEFGGHFVFFE